ncbi:delta-lactam-biosynthetic de-N-acetylase [Xylanibacillus composti]|nr:delta-lactam-biosynthetic de-N-acetylase [Xylanibacillus composti]
MLMVAVASAGLIISADEAAGSAPSYSFGFKKSRNGELPSIDQEGFKPILEKHGAIFLGDTSAKELYLTFDNGYENGYTGQILDVLKEKKVPAAFFVTGHYVKDQPELVKRMVAEGHIVGNHSWSHPDMSQISAEQIKEELERVEEAVVALTGQMGMQYLRTPRGIFNDRTLAVSKELGYTNVFWSIAWADWDRNQRKGADYAFKKVTSQLHPGAVILLHTVSKDNADALAAIIDEAVRQGYTFKSLDELDQRYY